MDCACGFSCGTQAAFERHLARFPGSSEHRRVRTSSPAPALRPCTAAADFHDHRGRGGIGASGAGFGAADAGFGAVGRFRLDEFGPLAVGSRIPLAEAEELEEVPWHAGHVTERYGGRRSSKGAAGAAAYAAAAALVAYAPAPAASLRAASTAEAPVRLLLVRHGRSENKGRGNEPALPDPGLTALGLDQAEAVGERVAEEVWRARGIVVVSSPMRRCLLTIRPAVQRMGLPRGCCLCHGAAYEFRGAGAEFRGTKHAQIGVDFPEYEFVGFHSSGSWDYRGTSPKESEDEVRGRARLFARWLLDVGRAAALAARARAPPQVAAGASGGGGQDGDGPGGNASRATLVLCGHQSFGDLLLQLLLSGTDAKWEYGLPMYRLQNGGITEITLLADGTARIGVLENDGDHLAELRGSRTVR